MGKLLNKLNIFKRKRVVNYIESKLDKISNSNILTIIYYGIVNKSFTRELKATLKGRITHTKLVNERIENEYLLTRNIHRIEKGLIMKPRKEIFALDYIVETMEAYFSLRQSSNFDYNIPKYKWFTDVLNEYFNNIISHPKTNDYKVKFKSYNTVSIDSNSLSIPYKYNQSIKSSITYEEFSKLCKQRRSVRWFKEKKVPRNLIDKAILAATQAPSACNRQPFEYYIIDTPSLLENVIGIPMGTKGYGHTIPMFIVTVGDLSAYFSERDRHLIYIDASLANMTLLFALETLGLSSCSINWPDIEEKEVQMKKILKLKEYQRPIMCIAVGYADENGGIPFSEKKSLEAVRKFI